MASNASVSFVAIVVLYCTVPEESRTLKSLTRCRATNLCRKVVVFDHSPATQQASFHRLARHLAADSVYVHNPSNPPLGAAYNKAVATYLHDSDYVLILDQDTELPEDYFDIAASFCAEQRMPPLMAPTVRANGRLVSPCTFLLGWGKYWPLPRHGRHSTRHCTIINSGAFIHHRAFLQHELRYDERLRLYGVDTDFFRKLARVESSFGILPVVIEHELSFDTAGRDAKAAKIREMLQANAIIYENGGRLQQWLVKALSGLVRLRYALRYRSVEFLK